MENDENKNAYEEILDENELESEDESSNAEQDSEEENSGKERKTAQSPERVIKESDLKNLGLNKSFVGKPYYETLETVNKALQGWNTKLSQNVADLQKKYEDLNVKLTSKEVKEVKEAVEEKLPEMPDPVDDPKGFNQWLLKRDELTKKEIRKELEDKLKAQDGTRDKVAALEAKENQSVLWDTVEVQLRELYGDDFDPKLVEETLKEYEEFLLEQDEEDQQFVIDRYTGKPKKLAAEIIRFHKSQNFGKTKEKKNESSNKHEEKVNQLKNKNKTFVNSASSPREKAKSQDDGDSPYKQIIAEGEKNLGEE